MNVYVFWLENYNQATYKKATWNKAPNKLLIIIWLAMAKIDVVGGVSNNNYLQASTTKKDPLLHIEWINQTSNLEFIKYSILKSPSLPSPYIVLQKYEILGSLPANISRQTFLATQSSRLLLMAFPLSLHLSRMERTPSCALISVPLRLHDVSHLLQIFYKKTNKIRFFY